MKLPTPRLELRWRKPDAEESKLYSKPPEWICDYALVLPLRDNDCRREDDTGEHAVVMNSTGSSGAEPDGAPFRDGAHAIWDSEALGGIPAYVIGTDGKARKHERQVNRFSHLEGRS